MKINFLSETAIIITLGNEISEEINKECIQLADYIREMSINWVNDIIPAYASVTIMVDFSFYKHHDSLRDYFTATYQKFKEHQKDFVNKKPSIIELEVDYNGIDLAYALEYCGIAVKDFIKIHTDPLYTVAMIGFTPGFPYLIGLDPRIHIPRRPKPRLRVPAGSLAIGGQQTGIYPLESPGGWHIIGHIKQPLFDPHRAEPSLLKPGDRVKFIQHQ